jgi:hypothetical protein
VAERAILIPVGAALEVRDAVTKTVRAYSNPNRARLELRRLERRGETALRRTERKAQRQAKVVRRDVERGLNGLRSDAEEVAGRVRNLA